MSSAATLPELIERQARTYGDKPALRHDGRSTSFAELHARSSQVANALQAAGIMPGDRVSYFGKNSSAYYELLFGAAKAGAVMTPINWRLADPEITWILGDAGGKVLFAGPEFAARLHDLAGDFAAPVQIIELGEPLDAWRAPHPAKAPDVSISPEEVAVQLYTSGTTGRPKGAMLTHRNLLVFRDQPAQLQPEWNRFTDDDVSLIVMPVFHIGGTGFGLQTLAAGATGLVATEFDAGQVLDFIQKERLSKLFVVPSALQMLIRHPRSGDVNYGRIRTILYGASPIPLDLLRQAMDVFRCGFVQMYGMTETCGTICALTPDDHDPGGNERMRSAGRPLKDVEIRVVDRAGSPLPAQETGEIVVRGPTVMAGYWNRPDETEAVLSADGWLRTGDAGFLDDEGYVFIQDRVKDMIVSGGENIYPAEVEAVLSSHPAVAEVAVIGVPSDKWGEEVKAIVVPASREGADAAAIVSWARNHIAGYKIPKTIDFVDALPRGATGKILRRELRAPFWEGRTRNVA